MTDLSNERLSQMLAAEIPLGMSVADARSILSELLERRTSLPVAWRPWDTRPTGDDAMEPSEIDVHEGAWAAIIGTNGKPAGWIDTHELFARQLYRHHILASPPPQGEPVAVKDMWLVTAGPDCETAEIVVGFEAMKDAVIRCMWPDGDGAAEAADMRAELDDSAFWDGDRWRCGWSFEDGYLNVQRITASLSPAPSLAVSDEMVDRALNEWFDKGVVAERWHPTHPIAMRAALTAALSAGRIVE